VNGPVTHEAAAGGPFFFLGGNEKIIKVQQSLSGDETKQQQRSCQAVWNRPSAKGFHDSIQFGGA